MKGHDIIVIGASAGGVEALKQLVSGLPEKLPAAIFVVLHVPAHGTSVLPQILSRAGKLPASHAEDGQVILPGNIYIAPPNHHLLVKGGHMKLSQGPKENGHRPAVDVLFRTAARAYGERVTGVVLSGVLDDGSAGVLSVKSHNGIVIVQDPEEAMYSGMPKNAIAADTPDFVIPIAEIAKLLTHLVHDESTSERVETSEMSDQPDPVEMEAQGHDQAESTGKPSVYICPDCGGVLNEYHDGELMHFRCQVGHAYSAETLIAEQSEALEDALWMALRALVENSRLTQRMAERAASRGYEAIQKEYLQKVNEIETNANVIRKLLYKGQPSSTVDSQPATKQQEVGRQIKA